MKEEEKKGVEKKIKSEYLISIRKGNISARNKKIFFVKVIKLMHLVESSASISLLLFLRDIKTAFIHWRHMYVKR